MEHTTYTIQVSRSEKQGYILRVIFKGNSRFVKAYYHELHRPTMKTNIWFLVLDTGSRYYFQRCLWTEIETIKHYLDTGKEPPYFRAGKLDYECASYDPDDDIPF